MKKSLSLAALSAAMLSAPLVSQAAPITDTAVTNFQVLLTLTASCTVDTPVDVNFGTLSEAEILPTATEQTAGSITVQCSAGTPYTLHLQGVDAMTGGNGTSVGYALFSDATHGSAWDGTNGKTVASGANDGSPTVHSIYGQLTGAYTIDPTDAIDGGAGLALSDTVTVDITY